MQRIVTPPPQKDRKITFLSKDKIVCPVCEAVFQREELFSGRVNADEMTDELHRTYKPLHAFGEVHPLVYEIDVCPSCLYAAFRSDFVPAGKKHSAELGGRINDRIKAVQKIFHPVDFQSPRGLLEGAASYYLALMCYEVFEPEFAPSIKSALSAVRAAWLCNDLHAHSPTENYDYLAGFFYRKARFYYRKTLENEQNGIESYSTQRNLGPDTDKNFGHEGVLYMSAILELKYGPTDNPEQRRERLSYSKTAVARMFGFGKKNRSKPGPLLEKSRELYDRLKNEVMEGDDDDE